MFSVPGVLEVLLSIGLPIAFAARLIRRFNLGWGVFWMGVATCAAAQIVFNLALGGLSALVKVDKFPYSAATVWVFAAFFIGFVASLILESFRWIGFRWAKEKGKPYFSALTMAVGAGSVDTVGAGLASLLIWTVITLTCGKPNGVSTNLPLVNYTLTLQSCTLQYGSPAPFADILANLSLLLQALVTPAMYLALSVMVWMAISLHRSIWFVRALLWHLLVYSVYVFFTGFGYVPWLLPKLSRTADQLWIVAVVLVASNIGFVIWSYRRAKDGVAPAATTEPLPKEASRVADAGADHGGPGGD